MTETWENIIKRGRSFRQRKKIEEHNEPIENLLAELEIKYDDVHSSLIASTTSTVRDLYGYEKQMQMIRELQDVLNEIEKEMKEQKNKIKTLPSDRVKGKGRKRSAFTAD